MGDMDPDDVEDRLRRMSNGADDSEGGDGDGGDYGDGDKAGENGAGGAHKKKRNRTRKRREYKPYSKLTWEEKQKLEEEEEEKLAKKLDAPVLPKDSRGRVPRGIRIADYRPAAPKNTTQFLTDELQHQGNLGTSSILADCDVGFNFDDHGSMAGLIKATRRPSISGPEGSPGLGLPPLANGVPSMAPNRSPDIEVEFDARGLDQVISNTPISFLSSQVSKQLTSAKQHFEENEELKEMLADKNEVIEKLKRELEERNAEIRSLKRKLTENGLL